MELRKTRATELDKFIEDHLLPDTELHKQVKATIQIICKFLKERCFQGATHPVWVSEVVKDGSSGKGTTLRSCSDADLVVFLTNLTSFEEQRLRRGEFITEVRSQLEACQRERWLGVSFKFQSQSWFNPEHSALAPEGGGV
uniref:Polymerase nucleotidyl transferase domain-containing protein n=1 Tax=Castor canadensis TaxID=51338 RepID=A0A8C0XAD2_CASCN